MKTTLAKKDAPKTWYIVDASDQVLGRLAVKIANVLRGRGKTNFTPHMDCGDYVIVINAEKVALTGKKETDKQYMSYSGWMGGEKYRSVAHYRASRPEFLITHAVKGMLPKNRLANEVLTKLRVFRGAEHPHAAQNPVPLKD